MDPQTASPLKRRAALGSLDANAMLPASPRGQAGAKGNVLAGSPVKKVVRKRGAEGDGSPGGKKACLDEDARSRTHSPDTSSLFDASGDASWATTTTEPDAVERIAVAPRGLTREQAREKAEILRLRLGLASYKLRTGQTSLSLAELQPKPLPPYRRIRVQSPSTSTTAIPSAPKQQPSSQSSTDEQDEEENDLPVESDKHDLPSPNKLGAGMTQTPQRRRLVGGDDKLTSSALRGGAANGLLSLARGDSSP